MRKNLLLGLALGSALTVGSFAIAAHDGPGGWGHHGDPGGHHGMMMDFHKLNLTDTQKASIKQIMKSSFEQNKGQFKALRQQREAFEAMSPTDAGYQSAAAALAKAEGAATTARVEQMANIRAQIYNVLTPAQQSQLAAQKAQAQARRQQWEQFKAQQKAAGSSTASGQ